jgi:hypothetical protein
MTSSPPFSSRKNGEGQPRHAPERAARAVQPELQPDRASPQHFRPPRSGALSFATKQDRDRFVLNPAHATPTRPLRVRSGRGRERRPRRLPPDNPSTVGCWRPRCWAEPILKLRGTGARVRYPRGRTRSSKPWNASPPEEKPPRKRGLTKQGLFAKLACVQRYRRMRRSRICSRTGWNRSERSSWYWV